MGSTSLLEGKKTRLSQALKARCFTKNIPLQASLELTHRCNLRCCHCYIPFNRVSREEMSLAEICGVLKQLKEAGTLFLALTGGEIFLREDLLDIIRSAQQEGFIISRLLTNGTLITGAIAKDLNKANIKKIELSIYGATQNTHDTVTQVPGSFEATLRAIRVLQDEGLQIILKMIILNLNASEVQGVQELARELGAGFSGDYILSPRLDGAKEPLRYCITIPQRDRYLAGWWLHQGIEPFDPGHIIRDIQKGLAQDFDPSNFGICGAGRIMCNISPEGWVSPCLILPIKGGNLRETTLLEAWHSREMESFRSLNMAERQQCQCCDLIRWCSKCPGIALLEGGNLLGCSAQIRELALWRRAEFINLKLTHEVT